jgi:hypothetical protein
MKGDAAEGAAGIVAGGGVGGTGEEEMCWGRRPGSVEKKKMATSLVVVEDRG